MHRMGGWQRDFNLLLSPQSGIRQNVRRLTFPEGLTGGRHVVHEEETEAAETQEGPSQCS